MRLQELVQNAALALQQATGLASWQLRHHAEAGAADAHVLCAASLVGLVARGSRAACLAAVHNIVAANGARDEERHVLMAPVAEVRTQRAQPLH